MDWITTSGRTLDEAKSHALDQLGIVADEAEFDVVSDVEKGLFGRVKSEAKIRARVRPKQTAVKEDRGRRRGNSGGNGRGRGQKAGGGRGGNGKGRKPEGNRNSENSNAPKQENARSGESRGNGGGGNGQRSKASNSRGGGNGGARNDNRSSSNGRGNSGSGRGDAQQKSEKQQTKSNNAKRDTVEEHMSRDDQEQAAQGFLEGVLDAFGMTGSVAVVQEAADDDAIEMVVTGEELGLLVGQKGITLNSLQELTRTVVQREADGAKTDRLRVDVAGYRARRTAALQSFAAQIAADVIESGTEKLLEPMGPADRKVVHDAVNDIDGVETGSEGEEPRRRVVIRPV
ncbi:MAG: RNA-binding cell elongation regulator Jag/EloR [Acidimicrobiia bacterium]|nr:RNA-binding cell elongation regulator Jag/EloR [Acidimicrobiia bacterium]